MCHSLTHPVSKSGFMLDFPLSLLLWSFLPFFKCPDFTSHAFSRQVLLPAPSLPVTPACLTSLPQHSPNWFWLILPSACPSNCISNSSVVPLSLQTGAHPLCPLFSLQPHHCPPGFTSSALINMGWLLLLQPTGFSAQKLSFLFWASFPSILLHLDTSSFFRTESAHYSPGRCL